MEVEKFLRGFTCYDLENYFINRKINKLNDPNKNTYILDRLGSNDDLIFIFLSCEEIDINIPSRANMIPYYMINSVRKLDHLKKLISLGADPTNIFFYYIISRIPEETVEYFFKLDIITHSIWKNINDDKIILKEINKFKLGMKYGHSGNRVKINYFKYFSKLENIKIPFDVFSDLKNFIVF